MQKDLQTLKEALRDIQAGTRTIEKPIVRSNGKSASVLAAVVRFQGAPPLLQALIDRGADVNQKVYDQPLLYFAASRRSFKTIQCLLEAEKIDVKAADQAARGGLVSGILKNEKLSPAEKKDLVNTLAQKGIDINARDEDGDTLLSKLVWSLGSPGEDHKKGVENIEILLAAKGGKQALYYVNVFGFTPWEMAAYAGRIEVAEQIIHAMTAEKADAKTIPPPNNPELLINDDSQLAPG